MLETLFETHTANCRFEVLAGRWPKPIETRWTVAEPVVSQMFLPADYLIEGRFAGTRSDSFARMGRTFLLLPNHEFIGRGSGGFVRAARCSYKPGSYQTILQRDFELSEQELKRAFDVGSATTNMLMTIAIREVTQPNFGSEAMLEMIANALLLESARRIYPRQAEARPQKAILQTRQLRQIDDFLENFAIGSPSVADIAANCGLSARHLGRLFFNSTGIQLGRYIANWRLRRAEALLLETSLPLKTIAYRIGFSSAGNFSHAFKAEHGRTPGAFRRSHR